MSGYSVQVCSCPEGAYLGARMAGTPCRCERCGFMTPEQFDALNVEARRAALIEAADLLASEARWQYELHTRHHAGAQVVAQRMQMHEQILRKWAAV